MRPLEVFPGVSSRSALSRILVSAIAEPDNPRLPIEDARRVEQTPHYTCRTIQAIGIAKNSNDAANRHKLAGDRTSSEMVGECEQNSGNVGERPETHTAGLPGLFSLRSERSLGRSLAAGAE